MGAKMNQPLSDALLANFANANRLKTSRDSDGTLIVPGKFGQLCQYDHHSLAVVVIPSMLRKNYWGATRNKFEKLGFVITQDGDCEGAAVFSPDNREQAKAAIRAAGAIRKRRVSPEQLNRQITWLKAAAGRAF